MKNRFQRTIGFTVLGLFLLGNMPSIALASDLTALSASDIYVFFNESALDKVTSATENFENISAIFEHPSDASPIFAATIKGKRTAQIQSGNELYESKTNATFEAGTQDYSFRSTIEVLSKNNDVYLRYIDADEEGANQWFKIPYVLYDSVASSSGNKLFLKNALTTAGTQKEREMLGLINSLAKKHNLFIFFNDPTTIKKSGKTLIRFDLAYDPDTVVAFFKELSQKIDPEMRDKTVLSTEGFEANLINKNFVDYFTENSYISILFDTSTQLPVEFVKVDSLPPFSNNQGYSIDLTHSIWTNINKPIQSIKIPTSTKTVAELLALYKEMPSQSDEEKLAMKKAESEKELKELKSDFKRAKSKQEKSLIAYVIAQTYDDLEDSKNAIKQYKTSAKLALKNSADYHEALAQAEWSAQNGKKAIEYFELAYKADPNSQFVLHNYGFFLLGLSKASVNYQDLGRALQFHLKLTDATPDDENLSSLYLNYLLMGDTKNAEVVKARISEFNTADNYYWIARAYHRMGNIVKATEYKQKALDAGYVWGKYDTEFFSLKF